MHFGGNLSRGVYNSLDTPAAHDSAPMQVADSLPRRVAGEGRDFIAVLAVPPAGLDIDDPAVEARTFAKLRTFSGTASGSGRRVVRLLFLPMALSSQRGEVTDKGTVNQSAVRRNHAEYVEDLFAPSPSSEVIALDGWAHPGAG